MYVYVHIYIYIYIHVYAYIHTYVYLNMPIYITYMQKYKNIYICTSVHKYKCTHLHWYAYTYIHGYKYIHIFVCAVNNCIDKNYGSLFMYTSLPTISMCSHTYVMHVEAIQF